MNHGGRNWQGRRRTVVTAAAAIIAVAAIAAGVTLYNKSAGQPSPPGRCRSICPPRPVPISVSSRTGPLPRTAA